MELVVRAVVSQVLHHLGHVNSAFRFDVGRSERGYWRRRIKAFGLAYIGASDHDLFNASATGLGLQPQMR